MAEHSKERSFDYSADGYGEAEEFWLIFTLLAVTMSQKSSVPQIASLVPVGADAGQSMPFS
jgi:hypothetical protein